MLRAAVLLGAAACFASAQDPMPAMVQSLNAELQKIAAQMPGGVMCGGNPGPLDGCLISSANTDGNFRTARENPNNVNNLVNAWGLPGNVADRLRMIVLAESIVFQSFSISIDAPGGYGELVEYVGVGRRHNGLAEIAIVDVRATAQLKAQHEQITTRTCSRCYLVARCCKNHNHVQMRGFTTDEINRIQLAMRATAYQKLGQLVSQADGAPCRDTVREVYRSVLRREPDADGWNHWTNICYKVGINNVRAHVLQSCEYQVRQAYIDILQREPDAGGFNAWSHACNAHGAAHVRNGIMASDERRNLCRTKVAELYRTLLLREPDAAGWNGWTEACRQRDLGQITNEFKSSCEYQVRALYNELLRREPDRAGWNGWTGACVQHGIQHVRNGIANSDERRRLVGGL